MAKIDLVSYLLRLDKHCLSKTEKILLETRLFISIYIELLETFKNQYKEYRMLIKSNHRDGKSYINFTQEVLKDILSTEEYSLAGIAVHTSIPEDVLFDIAIGTNTNPTLDLSRKLFELHVTVRRNLYDKILEKIISEYLEKKDRRK